MFDLPNAPTRFTLPKNKNTVEENQSNFTAPKRDDRYKKNIN